MKVTTDIVETSGQGEFRTTIQTFFRWNGSVYKEDPRSELPQSGTVAAATAELRELPAGNGKSVARLHKGDALYVFDRADTEQNAGGKTGFWLHATSRSGRDGWVHSSAVTLSKIDPLKINRQVFLGK